MTTLVALWGGTALLLALAGGIEQAIEWYWRRGERRVPFMQAHPKGRAYRLR